MALARDGEVVAIRESCEGRDHARLVASFADELLRSEGISPKELSAVAVSSGPGSYTGLRIGVSFAKGLCYGSDIPLIGVPSLDALVAHAIALQGRGELGAAHLVPMLDARRMEVYTALYNADGVAEGGVEAKVIDEFSYSDLREGGREVILFGDGAAKCHEVLPWTRLVDVTPSAAGVAKIAHERLLRGERDDVAYFEPFYLKDAAITVSKRKYF